VLFFVIGRKEIHIVVSVCPALLFRNLLNAFKVFFDLSLSWSLLKNLLLLLINRAIVLQYNLKWLKLRIRQREPINIKDIRTWIPRNFHITYWNLQYFQNHFSAILVVLPTRNFEWMSPVWVWIKAWKDRKAVFVCFFHKLSNYFAIDHNDSFSVNHRMFFIKEVHIFLLCDVHKSTDILTCLFIVCI